MKRKKILFLTCFVLSIYCSAQNKQLDSLKSVLATAKNDTSKVNTLISITKIYNGTAPDTAVTFGKQAIELAEKINFKKGLALAYKYTGIGYYNQSENLKAVDMYELSIAMFDSIGDKKGTANLYSNMGNIYFNQEDDIKATELYFKSLHIAEEINDSVRIITLLNNIGGVYGKKTVNFGKALHNYLLAFSLSKNMDDHGDPDLKDQKKDLIGTSAVNIGELYYDKYVTPEVKVKNDKQVDSIKDSKLLDSALFYLKISESSYDENSENLPYTLNYIGKVYVERGEYDQALKVQNEALEKARKLDAKQDIAISLVAVAKTYLAKGDFKLAIENYLEAEKIAKKAKAFNELKETYEGAAKSFANLNDYKKAYNYAMLFSDIKEKIFSIDADKKLGTLQFGHDLERKESEVKILTQDQELKAKEIIRQKLMRNGFIGGFAVVLLFAGIFFSQRNRISKEKKRSDELLLNILPEETAEELKQTGTAKAKSFDLVTVMFTDFKNFTQASERLSPEDLVSEINLCYSEFDHIITRHGIEKIKTIGDAYMCAGGLPVTNSTHPTDVVKAGLEMQQFIAKNKKEREGQGQPFFELRLGIHTGPVVAGIVGIKKFAYDIWGDTVNTASRMESSGETGKVNISGETYELVKNKFQCTHRGKIKAKNKGEIDMYFVEHEI